MTLTREQIKREYLDKHGYSMSELNLDSFMRLCRAFDCEDSPTYQDAAEKIRVSLESCHDDEEHFFELCKKVREVKDSND